MNVSHRFLAIDWNPRHRFKRIYMSSEKKIPAYAKLVEEPGVNKLQFLPDETIYNYNESDLKTKGIIRGNRHNVRKVLHKPSQKLFAIKEITMPYNTYDNSENLIKMISFVQEIRALRQLRNSTHIVQFYGFCVSNDKCLICMEYIDSSLSLKELYLSIHNEKERFPEDLLGCTAVAVVKALEDCHDKNILHRDVKPGNILIKWTGYIKLGDFGEAKITDGTSSTLSGTYYYWPPEKFQWEIDQMNEKTDIWSFGITLLEAVRGSLPYSTRDLITVQQGVLNLKSEIEVDKAFDSYEDLTKTFVKSCLLKWDFRSTCKKLKEYPFFTTYESYRPEKIESILRKYKSMVKTYDDDISLQLQETSKKPEIRTLLAHTQPFIISFSDEIADDNQQSQVEVAPEEIDLKDLGYCSSSDEEEQIDDPSLFVKSVQKLIDPIDHDPKTPSFPTQQEDLVDQRIFEFKNSTLKQVLHKPSNRTIMSKELTRPDTILENWKQDEKLKISDIPERIISEYNNSLQLAKNSIKTIVPVIKNIKPENHDQKEYLAFLFDDLISLLDPNTIANSSK
uniref:mitogen-activated protein kinase kinase n=1 Tax=Acrobeloides nanus TaxID=290746 RepID=A0A914E755_9BILA